MRRCCGVLLLASASITLRAQPAENLTLSEAERIAIINNPRIGAARSTAQATAQTVTEAASVYYPLAYGSLSGAGAMTGTQIAAGGLTSSSVANRYSEGVAISQLITDFGRTQNIVASARLRTQASHADIEATREDVLLRLDRAYFESLRRQALLEVARETVRERQVVADQVTALARQKLKSGVDVSFADVNLAQARLLLNQTESDVQASFAVLSEALGYDAGHTFVLVEAPMPPPPPDNFHDLLDEALRKRPEIMRQRLIGEAARRNVRAERDLWFPSLSSIAVAGFTPVHQKGFQDRYAAVGFNVTVPVFNGRLFSARRAEAESRASAEDQRLRALQNQVVRDVRIAWLNATTAFERIALTQQLLEQADLARRLTEARYNLGLGSIVELSQAQLARTEAQIQAAAARYEYQIAMAVLRYESGALP